MNFGFCLLFGVASVVLASDFDEDILRDLEEQFALYANEIIDADQLIERVKRNIPYVGIPVPGQSTNPLDIFQLYTASCSPNSEHVELIANSLQLLSGTQGEKISRQIYQGLFTNIGELDINGLTGRWYKVIYSPSVQQDICSVAYYDLVDETKFTALLSTREYYHVGDPKGEIRSVEGSVTKMGPDPGAILIDTGHPTDYCPYFLVKVGPPRSDTGKYSYMVQSQMLKHPVIVYVRDPVEFEELHKRDLWGFLEAQKFLNPVTQHYNMVRAVNFTQCPMDFYRTL